MTRIDLFCSDLDGTLLGDPEATRRFRAMWETLPSSSRPLLVYASGRLEQDIIDLLETGVLPWSDYLIGGVGVQLYDGRRKRSMSEFDREFDRRWDLRKVEAIMGGFPGITRQPAQFLHPFKSSWYLNDANRETLLTVEKRLADAGLDVGVIYSSGRDLDVLPMNTSKGAALNWLLARLEIPSSAVLVAGDTGNDRSLFLLPGVQGIVVDNAQPELIEAVTKLPMFNATRAMADGVIEGLHHFGVIPSRIRSAVTSREHRVCALAKDEREREWPCDE